MKSPNLRPLLFVFAWLLYSQSAGAVELSFYGGPLSHSALGGCCSSSGTKFGGGVLGRLDLEKIGDIELLAYSDGRWSEGEVLKPFYILGGKSSADGASGEMIDVKTVHSWRWISSFGGGYFSHTTRTVKFDLPALVTGLSLSNFNHILYSLDDHWSLGATVQISVAISTSDQSFLVGSFLNMSYDF